MKANEDMQQKKKNRKSVTPCKVREQEGRGGKVSGCGCQRGNGLCVFISPHIKIRPELFRLGFCISVELCSSVLVCGFKLSTVYFVFGWEWGWGLGVGGNTSGKMWGGGAGERKEGDGSRVKRSTITAVVCVYRGCNTRVLGH